MKLDHSLTLYTKISLKWIKDLNVRPKTNKQKFQKRIQAEHANINCRNIVWGLSPKAEETKAKLNKWDLIKVKRFCTAKEIINRMKRQPIGWENIFANH